jgi:hypothetical protein
MTNLDGFPTYVAMATEAIDAMYASWGENGGVSPSTRDEVIAAAVTPELASRVDLIDDAMFDRIWDVSCDGATVEQIATLCVFALVSAEDAR